MKKLIDLVQQQGVCSLPWIQAHVNFQTGAINPCCKFSGTTAPTTEPIKISWTNKKFSNLRENISQDRYPNECKACALPPGVFSYKNWRNQIHLERHMVDGIDVDANTAKLPMHFNFVLRNVCNLACRMCHPNLSTRLGSIANKSTILMQIYGGTPIDRTVDLSILDGALSEAVYFSFSGGEPLIDDDCVAIIKKAREQSPKLKYISFATNMTRINHELLDILDELLETGVSAHFSISLDGPKAIHEYIRYGCNWDKVISNIQYIAARNPKIKWSVNTTVSALNAGYVPEFLQELDDIQKKLNIKFEHMMIGPVLEPYMHAGVLPDNIKKLYIDKLNATDTSNLTISKSELLIPTAIEMLQKGMQHNFNLFQSYTSELDRVMNTDIKTVYPEFN